MATSTRTRAAKIVLFNQTNAPVAYDLEGHVLAAAERTGVDTVDEAGQLAIDGGYLVNETERDEKAQAEEDAKPADGRRLKERPGESAPGVPA